MQNDARETRPSSAVVRVGPAFAGAGCQNNGGTVEPALSLYASCIRPEH